MTRNTRSRYRTSIFCQILAWISILPALAVASEPYTTGCEIEAANIPGTIFRPYSHEKKMSGDPIIIAEATKRLNQALLLFKETWPGQKGFNAEYERTVAKSLDTGKSPHPYHLWLRIWPNGCAHDYDHKANKELDTGKIYLGNPADLTDPLSNEVLIAFNAVGKLAFEQAQMMVDGEARSVYQTKKVIGEWRGLRTYQAVEHPIVIVARPGESPFVSLTQKQYLLALIDFYNKAYADPNIIGGDSARADNRKDFAAMQEYLRTTPEPTLNQPARIRATLGHWGGFSQDPKDYSEVLMANRSYFHQDVPKYIPQFIVLDWVRSYGSAVETRIARDFDANFPIEKLQAMLDK